MLNLDLTVKLKATFKISKVDAAGLGKDLQHMKEEKI